MTTPSIWDLHQAIAKTPDSIVKVMDMVSEPGIYRIQISGRNFVLVYALGGSAAVSIIEVK